MGFSFDHISFANLFENGHNFITFSIMGMLIVFIGLSIISIYIALLPKIINLLQILQKEKGEIKEDRKVEMADTSESELLLAIAIALHLEQTGGTSFERITWKRHEDRESAWLTTGRMRGLTLRGHLPERRN